MAPRIWKRENGCRGADLVHCLADDDGRSNRVSKYRRYYCPQPVLQERQTERHVHVLKLEHWRDLFTMNPTLPLRKIEGYSRGIARRHRPLSPTIPRPHCKPRKIK